MIILMAFVAILMLYTFLTLFFTNRNLTAANRFNKASRCYNAGDREGGDAAMAQARKIRIRGPLWFIGR